MTASEVLSGAARQKIIELVLAGRLAPGQRIKELALSRTLRVSRTPLREALISLEQRGLVRSEPNVGFTVKELSVKEAEELYPLIWLLETHALSLAFPLLRTQVKELAAANDALRRQRKSPREASLADRRFHRALTELCRNGTLLNIISDLRLRVSCYEHRFMAESALLDRSVEQHDEIIRAIERGDEEAARETLVENWRFGMRVLVAKLMKEELDPRGCGQRLASAGANSRR